MLSQLGISLAVTTYQAGKVILVRYDGDLSMRNGAPPGAINTHFRTFGKPMGLAAKGARHPPG